MKKIYIILFATILTLSFVKCKPAAEEATSMTPAEVKAKMEEQAKLTADSIAAALSTSSENDLKTSPADAHAGH